MRCVLSFTACSGRPTSTVLGRPSEQSTSTSTGSASMPMRAKVLSLESMQSTVPAGCGFATVFRDGALPRRRFQDGEADDLLASTVDDKAIVAQLAVRGLLRMIKAQIQHIRLGIVVDFPN